ncbi:conserved exported hypothetical protein [Candidatus Sulfopaludibacter sp. SbA3]|nr:conserved exported hypothetical protein [Candidatus Sulfopaludibacter sp. SbA3]
MLKLQLLAVAALSVTAILAQDIAATWQGKLQSGGNEFRSVYKITRTGEGGLTAVLYTLDHGAKPVAANSVVVQGAAVKISFAAIWSEYQGKLSADGNTITGFWNSGGKALPLTMTRATEETAWTIPAVSERLQPMRKDASPAFEVAAAAIKPSDPTRYNSGFKMDGRRVYAERENLRAMIMFAYGVHPRQILDAPAWADTDYYDVYGQPDEPGEPSVDQIRIMYRKLLSDRFQLACHGEEKALPVFVMSVGKNGAKLARSESGLSGVPDQTMQRPGYLTERNATMAEFAAMLQATVLDRPVLDQTKLEGRFDFMLRWTPDQAQVSGRVRPTDDANAPPDLFSAMQEQLGLKLEATKAPASVLIIDRVEKPSEN